MYSHLSLANDRASAKLVAEVETCIYEPEDQEKGGDRTEDDANYGARRGPIVQACIEGRDYRISAGGGCCCCDCGDLSAEEGGKG